MKRFLKIIALSLVLCTLTVFHASAGSSSHVFNCEDLFTQRDLEQAYDLSDSAACILSSGNDIHISEAGIYRLEGTASDVTVYIEAGNDAKVQLILNGVTVSNEDFPVIYVKSADKVFVTLAGENSLSVVGSFVPDGSTNTDGVIFSRSDLVLNGTGRLAVSSTANGIVCKDDLKITGGIISVSASSKAVEANDSIRIAGGTLDLTAGTDGLHAENESDDTLGYIYISGGNIAVNAGDDGIHAVSVVQIDDGSINIRSAEGIEGTYIQLNGGNISIESRDDGINAAGKSRSYRTMVEINGGSISVSMSSGDTDGIDSNGDIAINGGTVSVNAASTFDYDGTAQYNGGTIIANGQQISYIPNQMMGGGGFGNVGGRGGMGGGRGGMEGGRRW